MAVPKQRQSSTRRDKRRSHDGLTAKSLSSCPRCDEPKMPHRICGACGYYGEEKVLEFAETVTAAENN